MRNFFKVVKDKLKAIVNKVFVKEKPILQIKIREILKKHLINHPTYFLLSSGSLNADFGFHRGEGASRANAVVDAVVYSINIDYINTKIGLGELQVNMIPNYDYLYSLHEAVVINRSKKAQAGITSYKLNWLYWILEKGGEIVITNYSISKGVYPSTYSRSEEAIMLPGNDWKVPSEVAGTRSDNWITQSIYNAETEILELMKNKFVEIV